MFNDPELEALLESLANFEIETLVNDEKELMETLKALADDPLDQILKRIEEEP